MESLPFIHLLGSRLSFLTTVTLTLRSPISSPFSHHPASRGPEGKVMREGRM